MNNWYITPSDSDLMHFGILGMKWGVRRFQNKDGSLTPEGYKRYGKASYLLTTSKKTYKSTKELDAAASEISKKIGKETDVGDGIKIKNTEYGPYYQKKIKTNIGKNTILQSNDPVDQINDINSLKQSFKIVTNNANSLIQNAAHVVLKEDLEGINMDSLKNDIKNSDIQIDILQSKDNNKNGFNEIAVVFFPNSGEFQSGMFTVYAQMDKNGKIVNIDDYATFDD